MSWRPGYWHCVRCRYDNYCQNVDCRRCGAGGNKEGGGCGERRREHMERGGRGGDAKRGQKIRGISICDRKEERSSGKRRIEGTSVDFGKSIIPLFSYPDRNIQKSSKVTSHPPPDVRGQDLDRSEELLEQDLRNVVKTKPTLDKLEEKVIEKKKIKEGFAQVRKRLNTSQDLKSKNMTIAIVSPGNIIKTLDKLSDGKTSLLVETFSDIAEYFGKFGTISDVNEEEGISKITFYEKSSAIKALSSSCKQRVNFYEYARQDLSENIHENNDMSHVRVENRQGGREDSRDKAFKNYEADVNSFLFGKEHMEDRLTSAQTSHGKRTMSGGSDPEIDKRVSVRVYSSRRSEKKVAHHQIPPWSSFGEETDGRFVRKAEKDKWRIAVEKCQKMKDFAGDKDKEKMKLGVYEQSENDGTSSKKDVEDKAMKVDQVDVKAKMVTVKSVRVPNALEIKLMALAGCYEEAGSSVEKVVLRSKNSEVTDVEVFDISDSDDDCVEVVEKLISVDNNENLLSKLQKANETAEKEAILKSMGIVSKSPEETVVDKRGSQLVDLSDSDSESGLYSDVSEMVDDVQIA